MSNIQRKQAAQRTMVNKTKRHLRLCLGFRAAVDSLVELRHSDACLPVTRFLEGTELQPSDSAETASDSVFEAERNRRPEL